MNTDLVGTISFSVAAAVLAGRAIFMLAYRTEIRAKTVGHDYSRELRNRDEDLRLVDIARWHTSHGLRPPPRAVTLRVDYTYNGRAYRNDIHGWVKRGSRPSRLVSLWIDPTNPNNITAKGPGYWWMGTLLFALGAILSYGRNAAVHEISCIVGNPCSAIDDYNDLKPLGRDAWKHNQTASSSDTSF